VGVDGLAVHKMPEQIILCDRDDFRGVEAEMKSLFIRGVLEKIGVPLENIWDNGKIELSTEDKIKLRDILRKLDIDIIDDHDGGITINHEKEIIAEWKKSRYELHTDLSEIDPSRKLYIKLFVNYSSVFDSEDETIDI
jgi:hypothetical protein